MSQAHPHPENYNFDKEIRAIVSIVEELKLTYFKFAEEEAIELDKSRKSQAALSSSKNASHKFFSGLTK